MSHLGLSSTPAQEAHEVNLRLIYTRFLPEPINDGYLFIRLAREFKIRKLIEIRLVVKQLFSAFYFK